MIKKMLFLFLFISIVLNYGFTEEFAVKGSKIKICILYFNTDYKKELVKKLIRVLNENKMNVFVDSLIYGNNYNSASFDAVIILSDIQTGYRRVEVSKYIYSSKRTNNIILIDTDKSSSDYKKIKDIDSITAASDKSNINEITNTILFKINKIVK